MSKDMTFEGFLAKRTDKEFTQKEIEIQLDECGYCHAPIDTKLLQGQDRWSKGQGEKAKREIREALRAKKVPYHFAYIKFYKSTTEIYALVAGKTSHSNLDFDFLSADTSAKEVDYLRANKARAWLKKSKWYTPMVLAVWKNAQSTKKSSPFSEEANFALSVEADIGGLFGLFSS